MKRLIISCFIFVTALGALLPAATAHAHAQSGGSIIWSGLWAGSNFDLSSLGFTAPAGAPAPASPASQKIYAALGDSVAAGLGLPGSTAPTGTDTQCGRSPQAYSYSVASRVNLPLLHAACSGATVGDLFTRQGVSGPNIAPQLDSAFSRGTPQLITITAGANDAHWDEFIRACYYTSCANQVATWTANAYLVSLQAKLYAAFSSITYRSGGYPPTVVITGYYNPLSAACTQYQSNLTADEITWLTGETNALNQTIQNVAARYSFVKYAPVDFTGHDICSADSYVQGLAGPAPFHPTAAGQQVIAASVLRALGY